ncbi:MAG: hypothetical protein H0W76_06120 [Pyrinomonadaceae bacterium]|nr:hypothetical protein [Pyrinomonadaceae bacterium]
MSERQETKVVFVQPGEGENVALGENEITFKLTGAQSGGACSVIEYRVAQRKRVEAKKSEVIWRISDVAIVPDVRATTANERRA